MGVKLKKYFDYAFAEGGVMFQVRLAMKSGVVSDKAAIIPDTPEMVTKVRSVLKDITGKESPEY
ncbi:MAG: hypothetical protein OEM52_09830 [bacterium]|nr:hypothetical protein [bacterium]